MTEEKRKLGPELYTNEAVQGLEGLDETSTAGFVRGKSFLSLSKYVSDIRQKQSDSEVATSVLVREFAIPTEAHLAEISEPSTLSALLFLAALFQVDSASASAILSRDGVLDYILDSLEIFPSSKDTPLAVASLFAQASGYKQCRPLLAVPQVISWLENSTKQTVDYPLRAAAAVALVKVSQGAEADAQNNRSGGASAAPSVPLPHIAGANELVVLMKDLLVTNSSSTLHAVEGLAYLTLQPFIKESVSKDPALLKSLVALVPQRPAAAPFPASHAERETEPTTDHQVDLSVCYGLSTIISNLCGYRPQLPDEERQLLRLRRMTKEPIQGDKLTSSVADASIESDILDDDDHACLRGKRLLEAGVLDVLTGIIKASRGERRSVSVQRTVAKALLSLIEENSNRGRILQGGGAKALLAIINVSLADIPQDEQRLTYGIDAPDLVAIQALAKLTITSPPPAVFGPAQDSYVDAIRPLSILLMHSSSSPLQQFESIMALTNITSLSPDAAERVSSFGLSTRKDARMAGVGDIVKRAEALMLDGNTMLRRAATELVCNLVGGAEGPFDYFGGAEGINAKSRLQILAALADVEDLPTRLAASGALAIVTVSPYACHSLVKLEMERHRLLPVLVELISPEIAKEYGEERPKDDVEEVATPGHGAANDPGLAHRGVVCVRNIFANLDAKGERKSMSEEAEKRGLVRALVQIIESSSGATADAAALKPAAEVLKWIVESGVKLPL